MSSMAAARPGILATRCQLAVCEQAAAVAIINRQRTDAGLAGRDHAARQHRGPSVLARRLPAAIAVLMALHARAPNHSSSASAPAAAKPSAAAAPPPDAALFAGAAAAAGAAVAPAEAASEAFAASDRGFTSVEVTAEPRPSLSGT